MKNISVNHFVFLAVLVLIIDSFIPFSKQGATDLEVEQAIKLHDLDQDNKLLQKANNQYEYKINKFKNEKSQIDSVTNGYNINQTDSFFTNYFK